MWLYKSGAEFYGSKKERSSLFTLVIASYADALRACHTFTHSSPTGGMRDEMSPKSIFVRGYLGNWLGLVRPLANYNVNMPRNKLQNDCRASLLLCSTENYFKKMKREDEIRIKSSHGRVDIFQPLVHTRIITKWKEFAWGLHICYV